MIPIQKVCNGIFDCDDQSDENYSLCRPPNEFFQTLVTVIVLFLFSFGILITVIVHSLPNILINYPNADFTPNEIMVTKQITKICLLSSEENHKKNGVIDKKHLSTINKIYHPCKQDTQSKFVLKVTFTLALIPEFKNFCNQVFDQIRAIEFSQHKNDPDTLQCISFCRGEDAYISANVKVVWERYGFFSKVKRLFLGTFCTCLHELIDLIVLIIAEPVLAILKLGLFYYDVLKDILLISLLKQVEITLLDDVEETTEYDFGGLNFTVTRWYLVIIFILSETLRIGYMQNNTQNFPAAFRISPRNKLASFFVKIFPIHFILFGKALLNCRILLEIHSLKKLLRKNHPTQTSIDDNTAEKIIGIINRLDLYAKESYHLTMLETNIQIIETIAEREPQSVVTLCLFFLMQNFNRIKLLFESSAKVEISIQKFLIITWTISVISIVKSIFARLHSHRYPIEPGIIGKILQHLSIAIIELARLILISVSLLNAMYLHVFLYAFNLMIAYFFCKFSYRDISNLYEHVPFIILIPTFYSSTDMRKRKNDVHNTTIRKYSNLILEKFVSPLSLYMITFVVYCSIGAILRQTTFPYNIKLKDDKDIQNDLPILDKSAFQNYIIDFPYLEVFGIYTGAIALHLLLSLVYYRIGHPWKVILWGGKATGNHVKETTNKLEEIPLQEEGYCLKE